MHFLPLSTITNVDVQRLHLFFLIILKFKPGQMRVFRHGYTENRIRDRTSEDLYTFLEKCNFRTVIIERVKYVF